MRILGVDEAGRGCVMGPLVVAGVLMHEDHQSRLMKLGVKDSKLLSPLRRQELAEEIKQVAIRTHLVRLTPAEIDKAVRCTQKLRKLNRLEARAMAKIVEALHPDVAIVDASDVLPDRYRQHIVECLPFPVRVISEHKADKSYPVVSAASIIAKVERDRIVEELRAKYGDFGSGYMSDAKTATFLEVLANSNLEYPDYVRSSWKPARQAIARATLKQTMLSDAASKV